MSRDPCCDSWASAIYDQGEGRVCTKKKQYHVLYRNCFDASICLVLDVLDTPLDLTEECCV